MNKKLLGVNPKYYWDFSGSARVAPSLTHGRSGLAPYQNPMGTISQAINNQPRLQYQNGACLGLLVEDSTTNQFLNSAVFTGTRAMPHPNGVYRSLSWIGSGTITQVGAGLASSGTWINGRKWMILEGGSSNVTALTATGDVREVQFETLQIPSSYMPTVDSQVTRQRDVALINFDSLGVDTGDEATLIVSLMIQKTSDSSVNKNYGICYFGDQDAGVTNNCLFYADHWETWHWGSMNCALGLGPEGTFYGGGTGYDVGGEPSYINAAYGVSISNSKKRVSFGWAGATSIARDTNRIMGSISSIRFSDGAGAPASSYCVQSVALYDKYTDDISGIAAAHINNLSL